MADKPEESPISNWPIKARAFIVVIDDPDQYGRKVISPESMPDQILAAVSEYAEDECWLGVKEVPILLDAEGTPHVVARLPINDKAMGREPALVRFVQRVLQHRR